MILVLRDDLLQLALLIERRRSRSTSSVDHLLVFLNALDLHLFAETLEHFSLHNAELVQERLDLSMIVGNYCLGVVKFLLGIFKLLLEVGLVGRSLVHLLLDLGLERLEVVDLKLALVEVTEHFLLGGELFFGRHFLLLKGVEVLLDLVT